MAVERCNRCDRMVDLDKNVEGIEYIGKELEPVCDSCITEQEWEIIDAEFNGKENNNGTPKPDRSTHPRPVDSAETKPTLDAIRNSNRLQPVCGNKLGSKAGHQIATQGLQKALNFALNKVFGDEEK